MSERPDHDAIEQALAAPFDAGEIKFKPQTVSGNRALALPYVDARVIQDRLDDVLGVLNWQDSYEVLPDGSVLCRLQVRLGGEWITKEDVGGPSEQPDEGDRRKAAFSDALKRAAVKFGIGRYLYRQKPQWVDYDPQKRQFVRTPTLPVITSPAKPEAAKDAPRPAEPPPAPDGERGVPKQPKPFHVALQAYDAKLAGEGLCKQGELVRHVAAEGRKLGYPADMSAWDERQVKAAREETKLFEARLRPAERPALDELNRLIARKGETHAKMREKLGLAQGEPLTRWHVAEATRLLAGLRDVAEQARS